MVNSTDSPFESIESTHEYIGLILDAAAEAKKSILEEIDRHRDSSRRQDALQVTLYKLEQLCRRLLEVRRLLNDLRTLRRVLQGERSASSGDISQTLSDPTSGGESTERGVLRRPEMVT
jgi:hypothetical protein